MAGIFAKFLSIFFRIPLINMIGDEGIGYYQLPYPIYNLLISISYLGLPSAISKLVSEKITYKKYSEAHQIFKKTLLILIGFGMLSSLFLIFGAGSIIEFNNWPEKSIWPLYGLALAPLFVSVMGAYRGYFQGMQDMKPTAVSQIIEQIARVVIGISLAYFLLDMGIEFSAGGAAFGATAGAVVGTIVLLVMYFKRRKKIKENIEKENSTEKVSFKSVFKSVIVIALPITLSSAISSIIGLIDSSLVVSRLITLNMTKEAATSLFGQLTGKAMTLINVPLTISMAVVLSIMPAVSEAMAKKSKEELFDKINIGMRFATIISFPAAAGLGVLSWPILTLLYPKYNDGALILSILSIALIFIILGQLFAAILQGMGHFYTPLKNLLIAAIIKYVLDYTLVAIPSINVNGAALASVGTYFTYAILNYLYIKKYSEFKIEDKGIIIKPLISTIIMALVAMSSYNFMYDELGNTISILGAILIAGIVYVVMLFMTRAVDGIDYDMIPGGKKLEKVLKKLKLVR